MYTEKSDVHSFFSRFKLMWCKDKDEELKVLQELRSFCDLTFDGQEKEK